MGEVEWGPAVAFLAAGLVVGALILWRVLRRAPATPAARAEESLERRDLLARLDGLVNQLRELEDTGVKRTAAQHRNERFLLELQAARTLLALDALATPSAAQGKKREPAEAAAPARGSALTGFFWGVGSAAALGLLFFFASRPSKPRAAGGSVTWDKPMEGGAGPRPSGRVPAFDCRDPPGGQSREGGGP